MIKARNKKTFKKQTRKKRRKKGKGAILYALHQFLHIFSVRLNGKHLFCDAESTKGWQSSS